MNASSWECLWSATARSLRQSESKCCAEAIVFAARKRQTQENVASGPRSDRVVPVGVAEGDFAGVSEGWSKYYWVPWREYLTRRKRSSVSIA
jgi:hypothetical protein